VFIYKIQKQPYTKYNCEIISLDLSCIIFNENRWLNRNQKLRSQEVTKTKGKKTSSPISVPVECGQTMAEATGTNDPKLAHELVAQVYEALWMPAALSDSERLKRIQVAIAALRGIKPQDGTEGMLATQMVATHNAAMECLRRAMIANQTFEGRDSNLRHAAKLLSIFAKQLEVLNKNRGKGQQKVTVEHVQVQSGGQAIVGSVEHKRK
jgi:hypothetical protein